MFSLKLSGVKHIGRMQPEKWSNVVDPYVPGEGIRRRRRVRSHWRDGLDEFEEEWWKNAKDQKAVDDFEGDLCSTVGYNSLIITI